MIYSTFQGMQLSRLGFGCMRFAADPATGEIDQEKVNDMFDLAVAGGVNYFDTAYPYLGGKSEIAMAEALKKYPRDSYYLADKFPGIHCRGRWTTLRCSISPCRNAGGVISISTCCTILRNGR